MEEYKKRKKKDKIKEKKQKKGKYNNKHIRLLELHRNSISKNYIVIA